jgi:hypothetical protein
VADITWVLGGDTDLPALAGLPGDHALAVIANGTLLYTSPATGHARCAPACHAGVSIHVPLSAP